MKHIVIPILTIILFFSCNKEEDIKPEYGVQGIFKIAANIPELEVGTKTSNIGEQAIFAYTASELGNSILNPLSSTLQQGNIYHYEIPDDAQNVLFSNVGTAESKQIELNTTPEGLLKLSLRDSVSIGTNQDVMFAYLANIESGNDQVYPVNFERMLTKLKVHLNLIIENDTIQQAANILKGAEININGFSQHLLINNTGDAQFSETASLKFPLAININKVMSADDIYMFPSNGTSHDLFLKIEDLSGQEQTLKATINQALEKNKYYTLTLNLKKSNVGVDFSLAEVIVEKTTVTEYEEDESSFLNLSSKNIFLKKESGITRGIEVLTRFDDWSAAITEGSEWFTINRTSGANGDTLNFISTTENGNDFRFGKVLITTGEHYTQEVLVQQSNGGLQRIVLYPNGNCRISVGGENFTIDFGDENGAQGPYTESSKYFSNSFLDSVIIEGENITYLQQEYYNNEHDVQNYGINRISLKDCYSLETLQVSGLQDSIVNFSQAPNLKTLACKRGNLKEIVFAEGTPLETLDIEGSPMTSLNITTIHTTLKELNCNDCSNLIIFEIYPTDFTGDRKLEKLNVNNCDALSGLNLTNFLNLKELEVNYCDKLEAIVARNCTALSQLEIYDNTELSTISVDGCTSLTKLGFRDLYKLTNLRTDGCSNLSDISLSSCNNLSTINFSNYPLLKTINISNCESVDSVLLNGCSILGEAIISYTYPQKMDFTNCSSLTKLELSCNYTTDLSLEDCSALSSLSISNPKMATFDPSVCPALEIFTWSSGQNITTLDFSQNAQLKSIEVSTDRKLNNLNLSSCDLLEGIELIDCDSLQTLNLAGKNTLKRFVSTKSNGYYDRTSTLLTSLDFSDYTELTYIRLEDATELTTVNLSGCIKLEEYQGSTNPKVSSIQTVNCDLLQVFNCNNNPNITALDFTGSSILTKMDCSYCSINTDQLNTMLTSLPDLTTSINIGAVKIIGNPGAADCDKTIVDPVKNWLFSEE